MAFDEKRYLDLTGLTTYDDDIKAWSNSVRQAGYKTVKRSASGNNLLFFKKPNAIVGTDVADESIDLSDAEAAIKLAALAVLVGAVWDGTNQRWVPSPSFDSSISATTIVSALNEVISDFDTKIGTIPATSSATNVIEYIAEQINLTNDFDILTNRPVKEVTPMSDVIYPLPSGGGGGTATLAGLADTTISNPSNDQILKYDATTSKWVNAENSGGGGGTNPGISYSTTETELGTWTDGKTLYQKVITVRGCPKDMFGSMVDLGVEVDTFVGISAVGNAQDDNYNSGYCMGGTIYCKVIKSSGQNTQIQPACTVMALSYVQLLVLYTKV